MLLGQYARLFCLNAMRDTESKYEPFREREQCSQTGRSQLGPKLEGPTFTIPHFEGQLAGTNWKFARQVFGRRRVFAGQCDPNKSAKFWLLLDTELELGFEH